LLVSLVPAMLFVGGAGTVAGAESPGRLHTTTTQAAATELFDFDFNTGACTHADPTTGRCAIPFYGSDLFSGDLAGTQQNAGGLSIDATITGYAMSVATYSGTVKGCPGLGTA